MNDIIKRTNKNSLLLMGGLILGVGIIWLFNKMQVLTIPHWLFTWKTLLILIGVLIAIQTKLKGFTWLGFMLVGAVFMLRDIPGINPEVRHYTWPMLVIVLGLILVLRALFKKGDESTWQSGIQSATMDDDIDVVSIFGGTKRKIFSKNFRGGEIVGIFGGAEIDLSQADINGNITLDITNVFGGTKLIVPANWDVKSDVTTIMGGMDDKRNHNNNGDNTKVLTLTGFCMFGGIDIRSY